MKSELDYTEVVHETTDTLISDSEPEIDRFISDHLDTGVFEKRLTQSEDVKKWIDDPTQISLVQKNLRDLADTLHHHDGKASLLDVGCYAGYVFDYLIKEAVLKPEDFSYQGVDIRPEAIAGARELHPTVPEETFSIQDLFKLSSRFAEGQFDYCFSSRVLVHLGSFAKAVSEISHCAEHAALILIPTAPKGKTELRVKRFVETGDEMPYVYRWVSPKMAEDVARSLDCRVELLEGRGGYATIIFRKGGAEKKSWFGKLFS